MAATEASASQKLADALRKCSALKDVPAFQLAEPESAAWEALRAAVAATRREPSTLDLPPSESEVMADALLLLAKIWRERKVLRGRVLECIRTVLSRDPWLLAAQQRPGLCEALAEPLAEQPEMQARLQSLVSTPATGSTEPKRHSRRQSANVEAELERIREMFHKGRDTMRGFDWEFPRCHQSTKLDTATEAFMALHDGLTRLGIIMPDLLSGESPTGVDGPDLRIQAGDWPGVLRFLASMYSCGLRKTYRSRIKFVAERLELLYPDFARAVADADGEDRGRFWSKECDLEASMVSTASSQLRESEVDGNNSDDNPFTTPPDTDAEDRGIRPVHVPPGFREQFGKIAVLNGMDQEIVLYVEETQMETRLKPGKTGVLDAKAEQATVRINFVGFLGLTSYRTRLAHVGMRHQQFYSIVKDAGGKTVAIAA